MVFNVWYGEDYTGMIVHVIFMFLCQSVVNLKFTVMSNTPTAPP